MKTKWFLGAFLFVFTFVADGHGGRLDKKGGHNCSKKSKEKGLCSGYHYHRAGNLSHSHVDEKHLHIAEKFKKKKVATETPST